MKTGLIILLIILGNFTSYSQTVIVDGISFGGGVSIEPGVKKGALDGVYVEAGYSRMKMLKPEVFYTHGREFLGKLRFQSTGSDNLIGLRGGFKYHFFMSLFGMGADAEYLHSITSNNFEVNVGPNFQINLFTPEFAVTCSYDFKLVQSESPVNRSRFSFGLRYVLALDKESRMFKR